MLPQLGGVLITPLPPGEPTGVIPTTKMVGLTFLTSDIGVYVISAIVCGTSDAECVTRSSGKFMF